MPSLEESFEAGFELVAEEPVDVDGVVAVGGVDGAEHVHVDVVGPQGEYLGGVIAPGLGVSAEALFDKAARLHRVSVRRPQRVIRDPHPVMRGVALAQALEDLEGLVGRGGLDRDRLEPPLGSRRPRGLPPDGRRERPLRRRRPRPGHSGSHSRPNGGSWATTRSL